VTFEIRPVEYSEAIFASVVAEAIAGDGTFLARLRDHWIDGSELFDRSGELLLGAFVGAELVGVAGVSVDPYEPKQGLGRVRHVYVVRRYRRRGVARTLLRRLIEHSRMHFSTLRLHTRNEAAAQLYDSLGFYRSAEGRETHRLKLQVSSTNRP
jgi:ribosomal protein S18 acetylase RimI-like enzyme